MTNQHTLFKEIIALSDAKDWNIAKKEWILDHIYDAMEPQTCLCGHYPIMEICVIKNLKNNNHTLLGNCCIKILLGLGSNKLFNSLKRIRKDINKSISKDFIKLLSDNKIITDWETEFYINISKKRKLSSKQKEQKIRINDKIIQHYNKQTQKESNNKQ